MIRQYLFYLFLCLPFLSACVNNSRHTYTTGVMLPDHSFIQSLDGEWAFLPDPDAVFSYDKVATRDIEWKTIKVPANWYLQGYDIQGVAWYKREFYFAAGQAGRTTRLVFEAVDYIAEVWLNGYYLGRHQGYFQPFDFIVSDYLLPNKKNILLVKVDSPFEQPDSVWSLRKRLIKGVLNHHDTRPGGAWSERGQEKNTGGIWESVYLKSSDDIAIQSVQITPVIRTAKKTAIMKTQLQLFLEGDDRTEVDLQFDLSPRNFNGRSFTTKLKSIPLKKGQNILKFDIPIKDPKLWWPKGFGEQHLYSLSVSAIDKGHKLDQSTDSFGFRKIDYDKNKGTWSINDKRIFLKGTNYIASQWLSEMDEEKFVTDITLMLAANNNVVRVHAHIEPQRFYRLCDEMGLLVWQDFPLQWGYSDEQSFIDDASSQVKDMIEMLYNRPSIIAWSMHNEPPWDADWMKHLYEDYDPQQNKQLDKALHKTAMMLDRSRYNHMYSATSEHPWFGWYSGSWKDYGKPTKHALITEFGAQALPNIHSLRNMFNEQELWPDTELEWEKWSYHNFQKKETFKNAGISQGDNIEQFIRNTQEYQARLIKYAAESYRRQKYQPVGAIFQFMFVEDWPSINWGIVDYWREKKAGYHALKTAYQAVLPSIKWEKERYQIGETIDLSFWIINDLWQEFKQTTLTYVLKNKTGLILQSHINGDIAADSAIKLYEWQQSDLLPGHYEMVLRLEDNSGQLLGHNTFQFEVEDKHYAQN